MLESYLGQKNEADNTIDSMWQKLMCEFLHAETFNKAWNKQPKTA